MVDPIIEVRNLSVRQGGFPVVNNLNFIVKEGETLGILGVNGAGKTTLLNTLSGFLRPVAGSIYFHGERIDGSPPHAIVKRGLAQVSQDRDLFTDLSVLDNLKMGAVICGSRNLSDKLARIFDYFPSLGERRNQIAGTMSGGEQQMLAIGRALMSDPKVLLLDEPTAGLSPLIIHHVTELFAKLRRTGLSMILVEQNIAFASKVLDRFLIMRTGATVAQGSKVDLTGKFSNYIAQISI